MVGEGGGWCERLDLFGGGVGFFPPLSLVYETQKLHYFRHNFKLDKFYCLLSLELSH